MNAKLWQQKYNKCKIKENPFEYDFTEKIFVDCPENIEVFVQKYNSLMEETIALQYTLPQNIFNSNVEINMNLDNCKNGIGLYGHENSNKLLQLISTDYNLYLNNIYLNINTYQHNYDLKAFNNFYNNKLSELLFKIVVKFNTNYSLVPYLTSLFYDFEINYENIKEFKYLISEDNSNIISLIPKVPLDYFRANYEIFKVLGQSNERKKYILAYNALYKFITSFYELLFLINTLNDNDKYLLLSYLKTDFNDTFFSELLEISFKDDEIVCPKYIKEIITETNLLKRFQLLKDIDYKYIFLKFIKELKIDSKLQCHIIAALFNLINTKSTYTFLCSYLKYIKECCKVNNINLNNRFNNDLTSLLASFMLDNTVDKSNDTKIADDILNNDNSKYKYDIINKNISNGDINEYNRIQEASKMVNKLLIKNIKKIKTYNQNSKNSGKEYGKLDLKNISNYKLTNKIFYDNTYKTKEQDLVFGVLLDCSGSMYGEGIENGIITMIVLDETLRNLNINHCIYGHNSNDYHQCNITKYVYFKNDKKYRSSKNYSLTTIEAKGGNCDSAALEYMEKELLKQPNKDKICLIFSDGYPSECSEDELIDQIKSMENNNIKVIGIGINFDKIKEYYNDYANGRNLKEMFEIISNILEYYVLEKNN